MYAGAARATLGANSNSGLWYDKFCDCWKPDWTGFVGDSGKRDWIEKIINRGTNGPTAVGDGALIEEAVARLQALVEARRGRHFERTTAWRFVTGLGRSHPVENGFAWHHGLGTPYLAGSGLKGLARAYTRAWHGLPAEDLRRMFGPAQESTLAIGSVVFLDALPVAPVMLDADVMTPHYAPWYQTGAVPGDWHSPTPIPFLTVAPGQAFLFAVLPRDPARPGHREDCATAAELLDEALQTLGAGAKTAVGYGQFTSKDARLVDRPPPTPQPTAASAKAFRADGQVAGSPVKILQRRGGEVRVQFENGDIEFVSEREIEQL